MRNKIFQEILDETPEDVKIFAELYADLVARVDEILRARGMTQKDLAERMGKSPSEISKWLSGEHNFTLRSIAKLSAELGLPLLQVPGRNMGTVLEGHPVSAVWVAPSEEDAADTVFSTAKVQTSRSGNFTSVA